LPLPPRRCACVCVYVDARACACVCVCVASASEETANSPSPLRASPLSALPVFWTNPPPPVRRRPPVRPAAVTVGRVGADPATAVPGRNRRAGTGAPDNAPPPRR